MNSSPKSRTPVTVVACQILQNTLDAILPEPLRRRMQYRDYGLHRTPTQLKQTLQAAIDAVATPSRIVLGYGLCGNGLDGIKAGPHTLIIPKVDDCIALLLGSRRAYHREMQRAPGTYYLNKGWLESGSHPLKEFHEYAEKYGEDDATWIMDQQYRNYERLVLIAHDQRELRQYRPQALEVARYCRQWDMRYEEILGSDRYIRRLAEIIEDPVKADDEFVVIPPGGGISQACFWDGAASVSANAKKEIGLC